MTREEILEARNAGVPETTVPAREDSPSQDGGGYYTDERVPHYKAANPNWEQLRFNWNSKDRGENLSIVGDIITVVLITLKSGSHYGAIFKHQLLFYPKSRNSTDLNACKEHQ